MERDSGTRSGLLWEVERLLKETKELPDVLIMENVPQVLKANGWYEWCEFLENLGYNNYAEVINAKRFGIPQNRERCFMVSILGDYSYNFPKGFELKYRLKDLLEENVDEKYYLSEKTIQRISKWKSQQDPLKDIDKEKVVSPTLTARGAGEEHSGMILINENLYNKHYLGTYQFAKSEAFMHGKDRFEPNKEIIDCILTSQKVGVVENDKINIIGKYTRGGFSSGQIVDKNGISPTFMEHHGHIMSIVENQNMKQTSNYIQWKEKGHLDVDCRAYFENGIAPTTTTPKSKVLLNDLRIRKLTPREAFRLMGVKDTDYNKITCSNAQKYKQAGNSIVTTCLMAIYSQLYKDCDYKSKIDDLLKELTTSNDDNKQINK